MSINRHQRGLNLRHLCKLDIERLMLFVDAFDQEFGKKARL